MAEAMSIQQPYTDFLESVKQNPRTFDLYVKKVLQRQPCLVPPKVVLGCAAYLNKSPGANWYGYMERLLVPDFWFRQTVVRAIPFITFPLQYPILHMAFENDIFKNSLLLYTAPAVRRYYNPSRTLIVGYPPRVALTSLLHGMKQNSVRVCVCRTAIHFCPTGILYFSFSA